jgi:acyl carrier protein
MEKGNFFEELKTAIEFEEDMNENTKIALSSLHILSVIALVDENFDIQLKTNELKQVSSVKELMHLIGSEKFN